MDETSPVYENFSNKMTAMSGRPKLNVTNMKSPFSGGGSIVPKMAAGSKFIPRPSGRGGTIIPPEGLTRRKRRSDAKPFGQVKAEIDLKEEKKKSRNVFKMMANLKEKIAINSKKITLLKNILQAKDSYGGKEDPLEETNKTIEEIGKIIEKDYDYRISQEKEENDRLRSDKSKEKQDESESKLENVKKVGQKVGKSINEGVSKVTSPIGNIFSGIAESLKFIGFGILANNAFDWLKDEENREKLSNFFKFIASKWKWVLGIGAGLVGLKVLGSIIGIVKTIGTVIGVLASPLALKAIAAIAAGVLIYKAGKFLIDKTREAMFGGEAGAEQRTENAEALLKEGVNLRGQVNISKGSRKRDGDVMKYGTEEQKAAYLKFQKEEEERKKIAEERKAEMKPIEKAINNLKKNKLYIEPRSKQDRNKLPQLNALGKAEEKRLQGILEQIQTKHDNRYGQPYSPVDKTPIGTPLTAAPKDKPVVSKKKANESVISKSNTENNNIDEKIKAITLNKPGVEFINMDLGAEREVDVAGDIDPSGGEINEVEVVNSINSLNDYMNKTPKIHQIIG